MMKEKIIPYQSCSKSLFVFLGILLVLWSVLFSLILISYGAWPITIFLGAEYFLLVYLVRMYFKNKNISENITIDAVQSLKLLSTGALTIDGKLATQILSPIVHAITCATDPEKKPGEI